MRLLRGLTSRLLACGCLVGVYETYDGRVVASIDARSSGCTVHRLHQTLPHWGLGPAPPVDETGPEPSLLRR